MDDIVWKRVLRSLVFTIVSSIVMFILNSLMMALLRTTQHSSTQMSEYEKAISEQIINPTNISTRLADVGGLADVKRDITAQVLLPLRHPRIFFAGESCLQPARGILLHGPPGTGKTMLARAIAGEANVPFISLGLSTLENKYYGESSKLLAATFTLARKLQPCVLFFDEIDGLIRERSSDDQSCVYGFKTEFLTHMDGIHTSDSDQFVVIGCTNCLTTLDPAVKRRMPQQFHVSYPTKPELIDIFALHLTAQNALRRDDIADIVENIDKHCTGSDVVHIVRMTWKRKMRGLTQSEAFMRRVEDPTTTAAHVKGILGTITRDDVLATLRELGFIEDAEHADTPTVEAAPERMTPHQLAELSRKLSHLIRSDGGIEPQGSTHTPSAGKQLGEEDAMLDHAHDESTETREADTKDKCGEDDTDGEDIPPEA